MHACVDRKSYAVCVRRQPWQGNERNEIEGADTNFLFWLRQHKSKYLADETEAAAALRKEFGFHKVYPEDLFYKTRCRR